MMKKALFIGIGLLILAFWGGAVLGFLLHLLVYALEFLELIMDTLLEAVGLTLYESQMVTAWVGFGVFLLLLVVGLKKLSAYLQRLKIAAPAWWEEEKARLRAMRSSMGWSLAAAGLVVLLIVMVFL
jgi:hypothetical protein